MKKMGFPLRVAAAAVLAASLAAEGAAAPQDAETVPPVPVDEAVMEVAEPAPIGVPETEPKPETPIAGFAIIGPNGERTVIPMDQLEVREATGSLEGMEGQEITLAVGGRRYVCPLLAQCVFVASSWTARRSHSVSCGATSRWSWRGRRERSCRAEPCDRPR